MTNKEDSPHQSSASEEITLGERLHYRLDCIMEQPGAPLLVLFIFTLCLTFTGGVLYWLWTSEEMSLFESFFRAWTFVADPGTHAGEAEVSSRVVATIITLGGLISFALMIGIFAESIQQKFDDLKKGRSRVLETGHTLILGWSDKIIAFIHQITLANESAGGGVIVVLAEKQKELMDSAIQEAFGSNNIRGTKIVCRTGSSTVVSDLKKVSAEEARSIVILADEEYKDVSDARALRTTLALFRILKNLKGHVVVEVVEKANSELVEIIGNGKVAPLVAHHLTGRLLIQCARPDCRGLAGVYTELLSFDDNEIYIQEWKEHVGKTFYDVCFSFEGAVVCGVIHDSKLLLNPEDGYIIKDGDRMVVVAEDDDSYRPCKKIEVSAKKKQPPQWKRPLPSPQVVLFCGWRKNTDEMIEALDEFASPSSQLIVMSPQEENQRRSSFAPIGTKKPLHLQSITHFVGDLLSRHDLERLLSQFQFNTIIIFSETEAIASLQESARSDNQVLVTTLLIKDILRKQRGSEEDFVIVSEICDSNTKTLVSADVVSDWVVSNELISMTLAQLAEEQENRQIWDELFVAEGSEIYLREAQNYVTMGEEVTFWELFARGRQRKDIVLGYKKYGQPHCLNPSDKTEKLTFKDGDRIIVITKE